MSLALDHLTMEAPRLQQLVLDVMAPRQYNYFVTARYEYAVLFGGQISHLHSLHLGQVAMSVLEANIHHLQHLTLVQHEVPIRYIDTFPTFLLAPPPPYGHFL